jgi:hypothetical protein
MSAETVENREKEALKRRRAKEVFSKRGRASKAKGKAFEKKIKDELAALLKGWTVYHSGQMQGGNRSGRSLPDVGVYKDGDCLIHCEAKHQKQPNIAKAYEQACVDASISQAVPVAVTRRGSKYEKGNPILVTMELKHWQYFLLAWLEMEGKQ